MGEHTIEMNFQRAKKQSEELEGAAINMKLLAVRELEDFMTSLANGWKGEGAESYYRKIEALQISLNQTSSKLKLVSDEVEAAAQRIYDAEMEALEIARERKEG